MRQYYPESHIRQLHPAELSQLTARVPKRLIHAMKIACVETDVTRQAWLRDALETHLRRCQGQKRLTDTDESTPGNAATTIQRLAGT
jgi:hypothetical protein